MTPAICASTFLDYTVLELCGDFDLSTRPMLVQMRRSAVAVPEGKLVVDLSRVTFLDCGTLREVATILSCVAPGATLVCPEGTTLRLLRMSDVASSYRVVPTLLQATLPERRHCGARSDPSRGS